MLGREADRFEEALRGAAQGRQVDERLLPLVQTARAVSVLAETPPPPPHDLLPGRQRFLTEAAQLPSESHFLPGAPVLGTGLGRLAAVLAAVLLLLGLVFTTGMATAKSLPGEPLYGLKLAAEQVRVVLTVDPQAELHLSLTLAEARLEEVAAQMEQGQAPDPVTVARLDQHLVAVLEAAIQVEDPETAESLQQLEISLQHRVMTTTRSMERMSGQQQAQMRQLVRVMERVRLEAQLGQDDPAGLRLRLRHGAPPDLEDVPGTSHTPVGSPQSQPGGVRATDRADSGPSAAPCETCEPEGAIHAAPGVGTTDPPPRGSTGQPGGPSETAEPEGSPPPKPTPGRGGVSPTEAMGPGQGPDPRPTDTAKPPGVDPDSSAQPTHTPSGPGSSGEPDPGSQPPPAGQQGHPDDSMGEPGPGPDPQSTGEPDDPDPPGQSGSEDPSPPAGGGESGPPDPQDPGQGNGSGREKP